MEERNDHPFTPEEVERFKGYVKQGHEDDCWEWTAAKAWNGQAIFGYALPGQRSTGRAASRFAYQVYIGEIPKDHVVRHKCDNPSCLNPRHLHLGTQADNMRDKIERGRARFGVPHLDLDRAVSILKLKGMKSATEVANEFGVSVVSVHKIWSGRSWKKAHEQLALDSQ